ncbi:hypothetical protein HL667_23565 [Bradyrhizobium sp. 83012]|uniref:Secreted protein n=1 Tax=Bradyrhizobium aeschynomenes TaxID=2734909 RepID=A0ABX2CKP6_9BRAD|nr:hypothetical protein [Bradyrhizobium aeschynomenes]NPU11695.1 hypothetical protein [Bradyrhizobium aeschynomenes]NPU68000.1 hypothetical protein [Bradyrhizobium aeschynomenes]NPV22391.1 hypothetical protein [Bradyrhizobium aeschynomenes]
MPVPTVRPTTTERPAALPARKASSHEPAEEPLTCVLGFAAAGLFAACAALAIQHEIASLAVLELVLICAAPPLAALAGLAIARRR